MIETSNIRVSRRKFGLAGGALVIVLALGAARYCAYAAPQQASEAASAKANADATTRRDQNDLSVTVYNSGIGLVRDVRNVSLHSGVFALRFEDVAASIMPATVHFRSLSEPSKLDVVEQNYEYDLLDAQKLLQKYVGREVTLVEGEEENNSTKWVEVKATLLADNNGQPVWKVGDEIQTGMPSNSYKFPDLPGNLYSRPTLVWTLENRGSASQKVEASYLTNGVGWSADYVLTVARDEKTADLDGWVTLNNNSGTAYENAKLQLVAGDVHRNSNATGAMLMEAKSMVAKEPMAAPFAQENFSEYHLYTLGRRTSIENNETKQISLLTGTGIPVEKYLLVEGEPYYYRNPQGIGNAIPQPVKVYYRFKNDEKSGLGMPLPAGTVRVYQADSKGGAQFAGENSIGHTPKDEKVRIYVGNAFDVVCERKETDYKRLAPDLFEMEYKITLRNHKEGPVNVEVREPIGGDWEVVSSNFKWEKLDSSSVGFEIPVEKDGTQTLDYRVRVKW
jgi:hypothetical protein